MPSRVFNPVPLSPSASESEERLKANVTWCICMNTHFFYSLILLFDEKKSDHSKVCAIVHGLNDRGSDNVMS